MRPPVSLRRQLILWNAVTLALLLIVLGLTARFAAATAILRSVDQQLQDRVHGPPPGQGPPGGERHGPPGGFRRHGPPRWAEDPYGPRFFGAEGQTPRPGDTAWDPAGVSAARQGRSVFHTLTIQDVPLRVFTKPTRNGGVVQVAHPLADTDRAVAGLDRALLLLVPLALFGAGAGGAVLTARALRPVRQITEAAAKMGDMPAARLPALGKDEFGQMAGAFNGLLARLDDSFRRQARLLAQQRQFTADASHELKTPLTVIQGTATQMAQAGFTEDDYRQGMAEIAAASAGMARLVRDLLTLARSDEGQLGRERVTLPALEVLTLAAARAPGPPRPTVSVPDPVLALHGNPEELVRLFANLLQNAVRATPESGTVSAAARREGDSAVVTVTDTGVGIAPEHLPHLGERFYRVDSARARQDGGTGLGLSVCRGIAEAYGGTLHFASTPGQGTVVTVTLPAG